MCLTARVSYKPADLTPPAINYTQRQAISSAGPGKFGVRRHTVSYSPKSGRGAGETTCPLRGVQGKARRSRTAVNSATGPSP